MTEAPPSLCELRRTGAGEDGDAHGGSVAKGAIQREENLAQRRGGAKEEREGQAEIGGQKSEEGELRRRGTGRRDHELRAAACWRAFSTMPMDSLHSSRRRDLNGKTVG